MGRHSNNSVQKNETPLEYNEIFIAKNEAEASAKREILYSKGYNEREICTRIKYDKWGNFHKEVFPVKFEF